MSDLSKVLGDLYNGDEQPSVAPPRNFRAEAPEWADDDRLDEAFADWTPGPSAEAHRTEHEMSVVIDMPSVPAARLDEDLAATLNAALVDAGADNDTEFPIAAAPSYSLPLVDEAAADYPPADALAPLAPLDYSTPAPVYVEPEPLAYEPVVEAPAPVAARAWTRADDDIIPGNAGKGVKGVKGVKAPKSPKLPKAKGPKAVKEPKAGKEKLPKLPKVPKLAKSTSEKAPKPEKATGEPVKIFGLQLRRK